MIKGARKLPAQHLTIRVPWHDSGWQGTICNDCCANTSCSILPRIAATRNIAYETKYSGTSIEHIEMNERPPCVDEHVTFMAPFALSMVKKHPYTDTASITHGHFAETYFDIRLYSAAAIPFKWLREQVKGGNRVGKGFNESLGIDFKHEREPDLTLNPSFKTYPKTWNQVSRLLQS